MRQFTGKGAGKSGNCLANTSKAYWCPYKLQTVYVLALTNNI
jgi:hypothetical protein